MIEPDLTPPREAAAAPAETAPAPSGRAAVVLFVIVAAISGLSLWYLFQTQPLVVQGEADAPRIDIAARVEGKSSLGRLGLLTHATAGFVDPGFSGHVTLELANVATLPIKLYPGMKSGQFCFFRLTSPSQHP